MNDSNRSRKFIAAAVLYAGIALSCLVLLALVMKLWRADLAVPFSYRGDGIMCAEWVKSVVDNGWYIRNDHVGMPGGKHLGDFPMSDNLHYLLIKLLSLFTNDWAVVINVFFLLMFPLIAMSAYCVLRRFRISAPGAYAGAVLFAFLHYHFVRGMDHIFLSAYYLVPPAVLVAVWLASGELTAVAAAPAGEGAGTPKKKMLAAGIICFLVSGAGIYYAFFTCFFVMLAGALRSVRERGLRPAIAAAALTAVVAVGGIINLSPHIAYRLAHGKNPVATARVYHEVELYALKVTSLLMPASDHRIPVLAALKDQYVRESSFVHRFTGEAESASLGVIAGAGFLFLVIFLLINRGRDDFADPEQGYRYSLLRILAIFNAAALLLAGVGGFNSFVAILLRYMIRVYARISIFIAFFSIAAVLLVAEHAFARYTACRRDRGTAAVIASGVLALLLVAVGLFDQTARSSMPKYEAINKSFHDDRSFVAAIEKIMPEKAMIFQLPYIAYPESPHPGRMVVYDHFRGYLHSRDLRWSYGAMKGRETDAWQKSVASLPAPGLLRRLKASGFSGVFINRRGYQDNGAGIIGEIGRLTGSRAVESANGELVFFDIRSSR